MSLCPTNGVLLMQDYHSAPDVYDRSQLMIHVFFVRLHVHTHGVLSARGLISSMLVESLSSRHALCCRSI